MKNFPIRQNYEMKISIKRKVLFFNRTKIILLKYKEASIVEIIDFLQSEDKTIEYFSEFILTRSSANDDDLKFVLLNFDIIWENLNNTFLKGLNKTKKNKLKKYKIKDNEDDEEDNNGGFSAYIALLSEKLNIDPVKLLNNYTLNQLNYLTEGIIYNINEQSEKGKGQNRMNNIKKQRENLDNKDAQIIKDFIYSD